MANGDVSAWDSSDAMRLKYVLPRDAGRERMPCGAFGLSGEDTKFPAAEKERAGGLAGGDSGGRSGASTLDVVGVLGVAKLSSPLLDPLGMDSPSSLDVGHWADIARRRPRRGGEGKSVVCKTGLSSP